MKTTSFRKIIFFIVFTIAGFSAKAQLDTVWIGANYQSQYIYPQLMDSTLDAEMRFDNTAYVNSGLYFYWGGMRLTNLMGREDPTQPSLSYFCKFAQRYDVPTSDSVQIFGVSVLSIVPEIEPEYGRTAPDTITIGVWDSTLSYTIYSKTFLSAGKLDGNYNDTTRPWYIEFLFDDTITLKSSYFISYEFPSNDQFSWWKRSSPCTIGVVSAMSNAYLNTDTIPPGYATKYKPYLMMCDRGSQWKYAEDFYYCDGNTYGDLLSYPRVNYPGSGLSEAVCAPIGMMPIRVAADTTSGDTTSAIVAAELLDKAVSLYPNPAKEVLNIASDHNVLHITVYDALNRLVEEREVNAKTLQISLANYASGSYFAKIRTDKGTLTKKFVVR